jgi:ribosomal protein S18 acetylase RimI-like enzyme
VSRESRFASARSGRACRSRSTVQAVGPIRYAVREPVELATLQGLFRDSWESGEKQDYDRVLERSFTWLTAHDGADLVGFVNVAWDGGVHLFLLDTTVAPSHRGRGIARELVRRTVAACRGQGDWLHVDSDRYLMEHLYLPAGFYRVHAGTAALATGPT